MSRLAFVGFLILLALAVDIAAPVLAERGPSPSPAATTYTLALAEDRRSAERNETITYGIWVNVSGGGSLPLVQVNFTLDPDLALVGAAITLPSSCATSTANATFAEWQCSFLRSGRSYRFTVPAVVDGNATRGRSRIATAQAIELGAGAAMPRIARVAVWILIGVLELQVTAVPSSAPLPGSQIYFNVNVTNIIRTDVDPADVQNLTAYNVRITIGIGPFLDVGMTTPRLIVLSYLTPSENVNVNFTGIVSPTNATVGDPISVNATVLYEDVANRSIGPKFAEWVYDVQAPPPLRSDLLSVLAVLSFALVAIVAAVLLAPILGERSLAIDEVFLVHRSGVLIQHLRGRSAPDLRKDDDLVASMFVAIQDFVRDSFHTKATLDELSFAGRKAAVLRGRYLILAALVSRGNSRYLFPQMKAVERALQRAHGAALVDWDGRVTSLDQAGPILESFLAGGFRRMHGWRR
ncbi:MAG TPA: hypothetical protein VK189_04995 [Thermoplasmata archaeon]|nr:hypothetical protein [Thermoplasmata archaeon]